MNKNFLGLMKRKIAILSLFHHLIPLSSIPFFINLPPLAALFFRTNTESRWHRDPLTFFRSGGNLTALSYILLFMIAHNIVYQSFR